MIDFLRANPYVTREEYLWHWTIPQILLASYDFSHVEYLSEKQAKKEKSRRNAITLDNPGDLFNDSGDLVFSRIRKK